MLILLFWKLLSTQIGQVWETNALLAALRLFITCLSISMDTYKTKQQLLDKTQILG